MKEFNLKMTKTKSALVLMGITISFQSMLSSAATISYPAIYPFVPAETESIYSDVITVTEDKKFLKNFTTIVNQGLSKARTKVKPWTASYWPLSKGTIADPFEESAIPYYVDVSWIDWDGNLSEFEKRFKKKLFHIDSMSEEDMAKLAPSEKYDLLLGDKSFDLTKRLWAYMKGWGEKKENAFISKLLLVGEDSLDLANQYVENNWYQNVDDAFENSWNLKGTLAAKKALELVASGKYKNAKNAFKKALVLANEDSHNYVLEKKNSRIAAWEGICNGWSTAAGLVPRPRRSVSFSLPNGKKLKFYPADIRGLISLYYVNSLIQDGANIGEDHLPTTQGTVSAGLRCNLKNAKEDIWGRKYDHKDDPFNGRNSVTGKRDSRCSGVHPATWHLGLVNLIGKQGRSFVVERKVGAAVDNHPMYKYKMKYFNPNSGFKKKKLKDNIVSVSEKDTFRQFRNKKTRFIVGVETEITYLNYAKPSRKDSTSEKDDSEKDKKMFYDLELDANYNIIGGQWRAVKAGMPSGDRRSSGGSTKNRLNHNQPDFFWTITKDYKKLGWFDNEKDIAQWVDKTSSPPRSWINRAHGFHSFNYEMKIENFNVATCRMLNLKTNEYENVFCEQSYNRPQPLINVINGLIELSK